MPDRANLITAKPSSQSADYALALTALVLSNLVLLSPLPLEIRVAAAFLVYTVLPGWIVTRLTLGSSLRIGGFEQLVFALGAGFTCTMLVGLLLVAPRRPIDAWQITIAGDLTVLALLGLAAWRRCSLRVGLGAPGLVLLSVTGLAAVLRLADLGWSEFQGDEARILLRAMAALQGQPDALLAHRKVPGEILTALVYYGQLGAMTELTGRLPFVLAAVAAVSAFFMLAREMLNPRAALIAGLLIAVNGYSVAFGRILQYEGVAFLLGTLALLCCLRFGRGEQPQIGLALLGSLLFFGAGLMALGALFFVLPGLILIAPRLAVQARERPGLLFLWVWPALLAGIAALGVVTWELLTQRQGGVLSYLGPRLGGSRPYWNWGLFLTSANHYLSTPYLALMLLGSAAAVIHALVERLRDARPRAAFVAVGLALVVAGVSWQRLPMPTALAATLLLVFVGTWQGRSPGWRSALVWAAVPLLTHAFLIRVPGTHWREAFPGLALLVGWLLTTPTPMRLPPTLMVACIGAFVLGVAHYDWASFVQRSPEYQMTFPSGRHLLDWSGSNGRGIGGVFGASHRHGWKALAVLQEDGLLSTSYATNESPAIAAWYLRRPQGCPMPPEIVIRTPRAPQDRNLGGPVPLPPGYVSTGHVTVDGRGTISITSPPASQAAPAFIRAEEWEREFDLAMTSPWRPIGALHLPDLGASVARDECQQES